MKNAGPVSQNVNLNDNTRGKKLHKHWWLPSYGLLVVKLKVLCVRIGFFLETFIAQTVYTVCAKINYKIVAVTNLNKYLHHGTMELTYIYIYIYIYDSVEITNKMQPCNRIYYFTVH